jgi:hypothetical protein
MNYEEFFTDEKTYALLTDAFTDIVDSAGTVSITDGGRDEEDPDTHYVTILDMDRESHIGLSPLGANMILNGIEALKLLSVLYVLASEDQIRASGANYEGMLQETVSSL